MFRYAECFFMIRIGILDDHQIVIDGLKLLLETEPDIAVCSEHANGLQLLKDLKSGALQIDILLMDLMMPHINGMEMAAQMKALFPAVKLIVLTMQSDGKIAHDLLESGAVKGFLPKSVNRAQLIEAIHTVCEDETYFTDDILHEMNLYKNEKAQLNKLSLSPREIQIIKLIAHGRTNKEIAQELFISELTVATHRKNILRKTNARNAASLLSIANNYKLL